MPFISIPFLFLFLPISLVFHFLAARFGERIRLCALIAISFLFCAAWDMRAAALLGCSITVNYGIGRLLEQAREDEHAFQTNMFLTLGVLFNVGVLVVFRYADFLVTTIDDVSGASFTLEKILVPLGVLFFSCDQIAYLADLRRGKHHGTDFLRYAAFASFFPRLMAGPLLRYGEIAPQWQQRRPDAEDIAIGLTTFFIGLAKTVLLAGAVSPFATIVFSAAQSGQPIEFFAAWTGVFAFTCQIYFDLSGYADMAIGLGRCFGLELPVNFRSPYRATNIVDFWRRWNITLSGFLRDYIYLPLGGDRHGPARAAINLVIALVLGGLWYGAGRMFVVWALLHGIFILFHRAWRAFGTLNESIWRLGATRVAKVSSVTITFFAVTLGWIFFRSENLTVGFDLLAGMFGQNGAVLPGGFASSLAPILPMLQGIGIGFADESAGSLLRAWFSIALCISAIFLLPNTETLLSTWRAMPADEVSEPRKLFLPRWLPSPLWSMALGALAFTCLISLDGAATFLHWRF